MDWIDSFFHDLPYLQVIGFGIFSYFIFLRIRRNQEIRPSLHLAGQKDSIDYEKLNAAEEKVKHMDVRLELMKNHSLLQKFYSLHNYDHSSLSSMVGKLRQQGISADYIFTASLPAGAASYIGETGTFELFVEKGKEEKAMEILNKTN